jgi:nucleoside-diphosphate-sugar epimerase
MNVNNELIPRKVLVTGGAGFIGSHLAHGLLKAGFEVSVLDNFLTGKFENIAGIKDDLKDIFETDIRDQTGCQKAVKDMDAVFHLAALPSVPRSVENPHLTNEINITGTLNMLLASKDNKVKRFIFASSSSVYGDTPVLPKTEDMTPSPKSPYALQKLTGEHYVRTFNDLFKLEGLSFRFFNVFGPRQDPKSQYSAVIPLFANGILHREPIHIYGDGEQSRDFTYVDNVVEGNILALRAGALNGESVNLACGGRFTLNYLLEALEKICGEKAIVTHAEARTGEVKHSQAATELAEKLIDFRPLVAFEDGLKKTVKSFIHQ